MRSTKIISTLFILLFCLQTANAEWVKQNTNSFAWLRDVFFVSETKGWIAGEGGTLLSTIDGGSTWVKERKFTNDALVQVYFVNETTGWLLCSRDIYARGANASSYLRKTTDGGKNWEKIEFQDGGRERVTRLLFNKDGSATAFGEGGIFYKLQEDGTSWNKIQTAIHFLLLDGAFGDNMVGAIVGAGGTIMFTDDSGFTWEKATLLGDTDTKFNAVSFVGNKGGWAVGTQGRIFRSNGGGARLWRQQQSATTANLNDVYFANATNGWAVGDNGTIIRTTNGGANWYEVNSKTTHRLERIVFNGNKGWAVGFGGTILAYDGTAANSDPGAKPMLQKRN
ncbi:MAG: WD40/YVTN/BNR-like repeat-containing protein [Pyrinomonadaceae bacterium]